MKHLQLIVVGLFLIRAELGAQSSNATSMIQSNAVAISFDRINLSDKRKAYSFLDLHRLGVLELRQKYRSFSEGSNFPAVFINPTSPDRFLAFHYGPPIGRVWIVYFNQKGSVSATEETTATAKSD